MSQTPPCVCIGMDFDNHPITLEIVGKTGWSKEEILGKLARLYLWALKFYGGAFLDRIKPSVGLQTISDENNPPEKILVIFQEAKLIDEEMRLHEEKNFFYIRSKYSTTSSTVVSSSSLDEVVSSSMPVDNVDKSILTNEKQINNSVDNSKNSNGNYSFSSEEITEIIKKIAFVFLRDVGDPQNNRVLTEVLTIFKNTKKPIDKPLSYCFGIISELKRKDFK